MVKKQNYLEIGRVCLINYGPEEGKLCVILDLIDQTRVLVDGPLDLTGVHRHQINTRRLCFTPLKVNILRGARYKTLSKAVKAAGILKDWRKTGWYKRIEQTRKRRSNTDFDRFKVMIYRKQKNAIIKTKFAALRKPAIAAVLAAESKAKMGREEEEEKNYAARRKARAEQVRREKEEAQKKLEATKKARAAEKAAIEKAKRDKKKK